MPEILECDLETYSSAPLPKCGVYRYADAPDFEILLFSYAYDDDPVTTIDLACGERLPADVLAALEKHPLPYYEWELYALDQRINDRGVRVDKLLVKQAMRVDQVFSAQAFLRTKELTGLENPGSVSQLKNR